MSAEPEEIEKSCLKLMLVWGGIFLAGSLVIALLKALLIYLLVKWA
jgi:hypothetical protein